MKAIASVVIFLALLTTPVVSAATLETRDAVRVINIDAEKLSDPPALGYELVRTFLTEEQWADAVQSLQRRFADWEKDNEGDMGRYLNDRFILVALGAISGDVEKIKKGIVWLAFYNEFRQPAPGVVSIALQRHSGSISRLLKDFSWEKASQYIKNKEWRKDSEAKKVTAVTIGPLKGS